RGFGVYCPRGAITYTMLSNLVDYPFWLGLAQSLLSTVRCRRGQLYRGMPDTYPCRAARLSRWSGALFVFGWLFTAEGAVAEEHCDLLGFALVNSCFLDSDCVPNFGWHVGAHGKAAAKSYCVPHKACLYI